jgi:hypothetical protein
MKPKRIEMRDNFKVIFESVSAKDAAIKTAKVCIVTEGLTASKDKFYTKEALKLAVQNGVFNGVPMFLNHTTPNEEYNRPERDINDMVATIQSTTFEEVEGVGKVMAPISVHGSPTIKAEDMASWMRAMAEAKNPAELSQHSFIDGHDSDMNGLPVFVVDDIVAARSVDFVTAANAGGYVESLESKKNEEGGERDMEKEELEKKLKAETEAREAAEKKAKESEEKFSTEKAAKEAAEKKLKESELKEKKESLVKEALKLIEESKLPDPAKDKLKKAVESMPVTEATKTLAEDTKKIIAEESEYIKKFDSGDGKIVFGNGDGEESERVSSEAKESMESKLDDIASKRKEKK